MHAIEGTISRFSDGTTMLLRCESLEPPMSHLGHERRRLSISVARPLTPKPTRSESRHSGIGSPCQNPTLRCELLHIPIDQSVLVLRLA